jgi:hypothetical protein
MYNYPENPKMSLSQLIFRTLAGIIGGGFGSIVILIGILFSSSFVDPALGDAGDISVQPVFIFLIIALSFLAVLCADLITVTFLTYLNRAKYKRLFSTLVQIFTTNVVLAIFTFPLYLIAAAQSIESVVFIIGLQVILSIQGSYLIMETLANSKHLILTLYASIIAIVTTVILGVVLGIGVQVSSTLAFLVTPITWGLFAFWNASGEMTYQWVYGVYGEDFLNNQTNYGEDYNKSQMTSDDEVEDQK